MAAARSTGPEGRRALQQGAGPPEDRERIPGRSLGEELLHVGTDLFGDRAQHRFPGGGGEGRAVDLDELHACRLASFAGATGVTCRKGGDEFLFAGLFPSRRAFERRGAEMQAVLNESFVHGLGSRHPRRGLTEL